MRSGLKVSLDRIENLLEGIGGVEEVAAVALESEQWGERVAIAYVGSPEVEITQHLVEHFGVAAKPILIERLTQLPKLTSGKLDRITFELMTTKTSLELWVAGARLRTLPLAFAPVIAGTGAAEASGGANLFLAALALLVSLFFRLA